MKKDWKGKKGVGKYKKQKWNNKTVKSRKVKKRKN